MAASPRLVPAQRSPLYFVLCDYGPAIGRAYVETDPDDADRQTILTRLIAGEYTGPLQVMEIDVPNGTARDVFSEFADDILLRYQFGNDLPHDLATFAAREICRRARTKDRVSDDEILVLAVVASQFALASYLELGKHRAGSVERTARGVE
jgi:hypothetical protein